MSDFDDILLLFIKMKKESFSRFGPRHQQKPFYRGLSSNMSEQIKTLLGWKIYDQTYCCLADNRHEGSKVWCKWSKGKSMFWDILYKKVTKPPKKCFKNI